MQPRHGLGLAIVQAIAKAHGAKVTARPRPEGGLDVDVAFPLNVPTQGRAITTRRIVCPDIDRPANIGVSGANDWSG